MEKEEALIVLLKKDFGFHEDMRSETYMGVGAGVGGVSSSQLPCVYVCSD